MRGLPLSPLAPTVPTKNSRQFKKKASKNCRYSLKVDRNRKKWGLGGSFQRQQPHTTQRGRGWPEFGREEGLLDGPAGSIDQI